MPRTTISRSLILLATAVILTAVGGCSKKYQQRRVDADDARTEQVRGMMEALRSAGEGDFADLARKQAVPDLEEQHLAALQAALEQIADAGRANLTRLDRFGKDVYRATIELHDAGGVRQLSMLLVPVEGELRWAKRN